MAKKKDTTIVASATEAPSEKKRMGRPKKAVTEEKPKKKSPGRPKKKDSELEQVKAMLARAREQIDILIQERDAARKGLEEVKKELAEGNTLFGSDYVDTPKMKTQYWYVRAALCPDKFVVQSTVWCGSFWDKSRFIKGNYYPDENTAMAACRQLERELDRRWPR